MTKQLKPDDESTNVSPITEIRRLIEQDQGIDDATKLMMALLDQIFNFTVVPGSLRFDLDNALALNSLRAEFKTVDGQHLFLKCHHEEGEADRVGEYYRSGILELAGFPINSALYQSSVVGEQMVIYRYQDRKQTPELHSVARQVEANGCLPEEMINVADAFDEFQAKIGDRYLASLHLASPTQVASEAVHGLYHRRLVDQENDNHFGGRIREYYLQREVPLPAMRSISFEEFWSLKWEINGQCLDLTLHDVLSRAQQKLKPTPLSAIAAVTAHGDDHTGNLLYNPTERSDNAISYFDPAFAGNHIPALLAPCKALYHICFAHPNMLYDPDEFDIDLAMSIDSGVIHITHNWQLSPLRQSFLSSQLEHVWTPLLNTMQEQDLLAEDWIDTVGSALFCCPVLCKNLLAGAGNPNPLTPNASMLTFSIAMQLASGQLGDHRLSHVIRH